VNETAPDLGAWTKPLLSSNTCSVYSERVKVQRPHVWIDHGNQMLPQGRPTDRMASDPAR